MSKVGRAISAAIAMDEDGRLLCPCCSGIHMGHEAVNVYARAAEDAPVGMHVFSSRAISGSNTSAPMDGNPSPRRGGLTVHLICEDCGATPVLAIAQHKGSTHLEWRGNE